MKCRGAAIVFGWLSLMVQLAASAAASMAQLEDQWRDKGQVFLPTRKPANFFQFDSSNQNQADLEEADSFANGDVVPLPSMVAEVQPAAPQAMMVPAPLRQELNLMQAALENEEAKEMKSVQSELELHEKEIMQEMKFSALQMEKRMLQVQNAAARQMLQSEAFAGQNELPARQMSMASLVAQQQGFRQTQPMMLRGPIMAAPQALRAPASWGRAIWQSSMPGMANAVVMPPQGMMPSLAQERPLTGPSAMMPQPQVSFMQQGYAPMPGQFPLAPAAGGYQGVMMAR